MTSALMNKLRLVSILAVAMLWGCKTVYVPVKETEYVTVKDSVYVRDTTVQFKVEKEYVRDYTGLLDTLEMGTSYASARAWVDTTRNMLAGEMKNREKVVDVPVQVKEKVTVRDSIVYQDKPVPVEVFVTKTKYPAAFWWLLGWCLLSIGYIAVKVYFKRQISR